MCYKYALMIMGLFLTFVGCKSRDNTSAILSSGVPAEFEIDIPSDKNYVSNIISGTNVLQLKLIPKATGFIRMRVHIYCANCQAIPYARLTANDGKVFGQGAFAEVGQEAGTTYYGVRANIFVDKLEPFTLEMTSDKDFTSGSKVYWDYNFDYMTPNLLDAGGERLGGIKPPSEVNGKTLRISLPDASAAGLYSIGLNGFVQDYDNAISPLPSYNSPPTPSSSNIFKKVLFTADLNGNSKKVDLSNFSATDVSFLFQSEPGQKNFLDVTFNDSLSTANEIALGLYLTKVAFNEPLPLVKLVVNHNGDFNYSQPAGIMSKAKPEGGISFSFKDKDHSAILGLQLLAERPVNGLVDPKKEDMFLPVVAKVRKVGSNRVLKVITTKPGDVTVYALSATFKKGDYIVDLSVGDPGSASSTAIDKAFVTMRSIRLNKKNHTTDPLSTTARAAIKNFENSNGKLPAQPPRNYDADAEATQPYHPPVEPIPLQASVVLDAMEDLRLHYNAVINADQNYKDYSYEIKLSCLSNPAPHWSDLTIHYYCQFTPQLRQCYTDTIRSLAEAQKAILVDPASSADQKAQAMKDLKLVRDKAYDTCAATSSSSEEWKWLTSSKFKHTLEDRSEIEIDHADVFKYVMNSQTYAFKSNQIQAVLNAFYRVSDPEDPEWCRFFRDPRGLDINDDSGGTGRKYCLDHDAKSSHYKLFTEPLRGAHR